MKIDPGAHCPHMKKTDTPSNKHYQLKINQVLAIATATAAATDDYDENGGLAHKPFEILYGASGYLTALLFLRAHGFMAEEVSDAVVGQVARWIVEGGEDGPGCVVVCVCVCDGVFVWAGVDDGMGCVV